MKKQIFPKTLVLICFLSFLISFDTKQVNTEEISLYKRMLQKTLIDGKSIQLTTQLVLKNETKESKKRYYEIKRSNGNYLLNYEDEGTVRSRLLNKIDLDKILTRIIELDNSKLSSQTQVDEYNNNQLNWGDNSCNI